MNVYEAVKSTVTTRQAAEYYGIKVTGRGMARCPFHHDRYPSMKLDQRFHCFGCQADGDVLDFVAGYFSLSVREAAMKLAEDFGIRYEKQRPPDRGKRKKKVKAAPLVSARQLLKPPCTERYARWCERTAANHRLLLDGKMNFILTDLYHLEYICKSPEYHNPEYGRDHSAL